MERTDENIEKLTNVVVDSWDMNTLIGFAKSRLTVDYSEDKELFNSDVELWI